MCDVAEMATVLAWLELNGLLALLNADPTECGITSARANALRSKRSIRESLAVSNQAAEIKVRAERKAGEMIATLEKAKNQHSKSACDTMSQATKGEQLEELGFDRKQASRLESMARVPDDEFEQLADADTATSEGLPRLRSEQNTQSRIPTVGI